MSNKVQLLLVHGGETFSTYEKYLAFLESMELSLEKTEKWNKKYFDEKLEESLGGKVKINASNKSIEIVEEFLQK